MGLMVMLLVAAAGMVHAQQREVVRARHELDGRPIVVTATRSGFRLLRVGRDAELRGAVKQKEPGYLALPYTRSLVCVLGFQEVVPRRVLMLGMGAGSIPRFLTSQFDVVNIEVVEPVELYVKLAKEHFGLKDGPRLTVHEAKPREFVEKVHKKYDLVVLDRYVQGNIPYRMATREFFREVRRKMERSGHFVIHVWEKEDTPNRDEILAGAQAIFGEVYLLDVPNSDSAIIICAHRDGQTTQAQAVARAREIMQESPLPFELPSIIARQYQYATKMQVGARALSDDNAPLTVD
jgi:spermidine synthase